MLIAKLWGGITDDQFDLLKEHLEIKKYKKNEIIYKNEGTPEYALCLIAGKVKIYKEGIGCQEFFRLFLTHKSLSEISDPRQVGHGYVSG